MKISSLRRKLILGSGLFTLAGVFPLISRSTDKPLGSASINNVPDGKIGLLGILGGMGSRPGLYFQDKYLEIAEANGAIRDQDYPKFIYLNASESPNKTNRILFEKGFWESNKEPENPYPYLLDDMKKLKEAGVDTVVIACNAAHYWRERLEKDSGMKILSLMYYTQKTIEEKNPKGNYLLLATEGTYSCGLYANVVPEGKLITPELSDQRLIGEVINGDSFMAEHFPQYKPVGVKKPLKLGYDKENFTTGEADPKKIVMDMIAKYEKQNKLDGVILGVTEIPLCIDKKTRKNASIQFFDPAESALKVAYKLQQPNLITNN